MIQVPVQCQATAAHAWSCAAHLRTSLQTSTSPSVRLTTSARPPDVDTCVPVYTSHKRHPASSKPPRVWDVTLFGYFCEAIKHLIFDFPMIWSAIVPAKARIVIWKVMKKQFIWWNGSRLSIMN